MTGTKKNVQISKENRLLPLKGGGGGGGGDYTSNHQNLNTYL